MTEAPVFRQKTYLMEVRVMGDYNVDISEVEQANDLVAQKEADVITSEQEDTLDKKHKVAFYVILGLIGLSGIGIPILVIFLVREIRAKKALEKQIAESNKVSEEQPAEAATDVKVEETKEEPKKEDKAPEKK